VKFLVDAQLPPMLADWLRKAGHEALHVQDVGFATRMTRPFAPMLAKTASSS